MSKEANPTNKLDVESLSCWCDTKQNKTESLLNAVWVNAESSGSYWITFPVFWIECSLWDSSERYYRTKHEQCDPDGRIFQS